MRELAAFLAALFAVALLASADAVAAPGGPCGQYRCDSNATCVDPVKASCKCRTGFAGDGLRCEAINPCTIDRGGCDINATCAVTGRNEPTCTCRHGFTGDGTTCEPTAGPVKSNSCVTNNGGCNSNAICKSIGPGLNKCTCKPGFKGDGKTCTKT